MKDDESRISRLERNLARTQILVGILVIVSVARFHPELDQIIKDSILILPLILGGLIFTVFLIYWAERLLGNEKMYGKQDEKDN